MEETALAAYRLALVGDFSAARSWVEEFEQSSAAQLNGCNALLQACLWFTDDRVASPVYESTDALLLTNGEEREAAALSCVFPLWAAWLGCDAGGFSRWLARLGELVEPIGDGTAALWHAHFALWDASRTAPTAQQCQEAQRLAARAARLGDATLVVLTTAQAAFIAAGSGDLTTATSLARRASRMSRTEGQPQAEYMSNLVLARVRRLCGRPHLATRILRSLGELAQERWHAAITWEKLVNGDLDAWDERFGETLDVDTAEPLVVRAGALQRAIAAAATGSRADFDDHVSRIAQGDWFFGAHRQEAMDIVAALDPHRRSEDVPTRIQAWVSGTTNETPPSLAGFVPPSDGAKDWGVGAAALYATPQGHVRRVLIAGHRLAPQDTHLLLPPARGQGRREHAVCILAGRLLDGIASEELFEKLYGFALDPRAHQSAFTSLLTRVRDGLGAAATLETNKGICTLSIAAPCLISDPRCLRNDEDNLLRVLASLGQVSAKEASAMLHVPLRTVQASLRILTEDGSCMAVQDGRRIKYVIEDTTYREPTLAS